MSNTSARALPAALPKATLTETFGVIFHIFVPTIAKGVIIRRPKLVALAERLDLDRRAVRCLQKMRAIYGPGPLMLRIPFRSQALILDPAHVHRVLSSTPDPFATASS